MASMVPKRFSRMEVLRQVSPDSLVGLLAAEGGEDYFAQRGCPLPRDGKAPDFEGIQTVLLKPDTDTPGTLAEALHHIDEMATDEAMQAILDRCAEEGIDLGVGQDASPADVAVRLWLKSPQLLLDLHAEGTALRKRTYDYFSGNRRRADRLGKPAEEALRALEADLDHEFEEMKKGEMNIRVQAHSDGTEHRFLVRHGDPIQRVGTVDRGTMQGIVLRPVVFDMIVYNEERDELAICAKTLRDKEAYCRAFGLHLFGRDDYFPPERKYTLEPLRLGRNSVTWLGIAGIGDVRLCEVRYAFGSGGETETEIHKANDVFARMDRRNATIPEQARIVSATFKVKFTSGRSRAARTVTIRPPNVAQYTRDEDGEAAERWLSRQGFINEPHDAAGSES
jgi:hypothetical protein